MLDSGADGPGFKSKNPTFASRGVNSPVGIHVFEIILQVCRGYGYAVGMG